MSRRKITHPEHVFTPPPEAEQDRITDQDWCSGCGKWTQWDGEICLACGYEWGSA